LPICAITAHSARQSRKIRAMPSPALPPLAAADHIAGLSKGLAVLESFDTERQRLNATLAAQRAGITRAAARRHLLTLAHLGYLESDGRYFWLSPKVLRLSGSYLASARLPRLVQPALHRLSVQTGLPFSAAVLDGSEVVIVARSAPFHDAGSQRLAHGLHLGSRLPAHATSTGRVLLAAMEEDALAAWLAARTLPRLTAHTVTQPAGLLPLLRQVRAQDFCIAVEEHELGVQAAAVPLRDAMGRTVAALNVVAAPQRVAAQALEGQLVPLLQEAARELREVL
jgi:IclR family pca regulon transcriptional regulator